MNPAHRFFVHSAVALFLALPASWAPAVSLVPGVQAPLDGTSQAQRPELGEPMVPTQLLPLELRHAGSGAPRLQGAVGVALTTLSGSARLVQH